MVGFISELSFEDDSDKVSKIKTFRDPLDSLDLKINDLSFADSFLDFDSIKEWFEDKPIEESEFRVLDRSMEVHKEQPFERIPVGNQITPGLEPNVNESEQNVGENKSIVIGPEPVGDTSSCIQEMMVEEEGLKSDASFRFCVEEKMGKVTLVDGQDISTLDLGCGNSVKCSGDGENGRSCLEESESEGSSSSSSSSSSDDDDDDDDDNDDNENDDEVGEQEDANSNEEEDNYDEKKIELMIEEKSDEEDNLEEGEIRGALEVEQVLTNGESRNDDDDDEEDNAEDADLATNVEFDDGDDEEEAVGATRGPIKSKNELQELPPVPTFDVALQPHHKMLPVGVILSRIGAQVIVEGSEKHNPLNEGSILWITKKRLPLGLVDEIFGPVKNPYYMVRYNSEAEVPVGIHEGTLVSFVPEFANHVLNEKNLHKKGYDASGENDEEVSDDGEFSDDEKEAEYRRMQKLTKRGMNDQRPGNKRYNKKAQNKGGSWRNGRHSAEMKQSVNSELPGSSNRYNVPTESVNSQLSQSAIRQNLVGGGGLVPSFPVMQQSAGFITPPTGSEMWINDIPGQQLQTSIFHSRFSTGNLPFISQNNQQLPYPMIMPNQMLMPFPQQLFNPGQCSLPNMVLPGGQPNLGSFAHWSGIAGQAGFNQGIPGMRSLAEQATVTLEQSNLPNLQQPSVVPSNFGTSQQFNVGTSSSRGRKNFRGGRFTGGRGRQPFK